MLHRRDYRLRVHALIPLLFFLGAALRIVLRGGMTEVERWVLMVSGVSYAAALAVVFALEGRRALVTDARGLERRGGGGFRIAWSEVEELRERYQPGRLRTQQASLELVTAAASHRVDAGWQDYPGLVRECAERTTEAILARLEPRLAEGVALVFGAVTVEHEVVILKKRSGPPLRVAIADLAGLRLHHGWLVCYLREGTRAAQGWVARQLGEVSNPYALIELLLRHGAGRTPGPPPGELTSD